MVKVFLVEDESIIRRGIRDNIAWESHGFEFVGEAGDGEYAYPLILNTKPDILITDIKMPFMDGLELSRLVKKSLPKTRIIILSGYNEFEYAKEAIKMEAAEYLLKPVNAVELKEVFERVKNDLDRELDELQLAVVDAAVKAKKPILAICRGMQLVNIYFGGTIIQDLEKGNMHTYESGEIKLHNTINIRRTPFELMYGASGIVNSAHHQAVKKPGKGFKIGQVWFSGILSKEEKEEWMRKIENEEKVEVECKRSCIIEGMVHKELPIIAVQWHPELMHADPVSGTLDQDRMFVYFASMYE